MIKKKRLVAQWTVYQCMGFCMTKTSDPPGSGSPTHRSCCISIYSLQKEAPSSFIHSLVSSFIQQTSIDQILCSWPSSRAWQSKINRQVPALQVLHGTTTRIDTQSCVRCQEENYTERYNVEVLNVLWKWHHRTWTGRAQPREGNLNGMGSSWSGTHQGESAQQKKRDREKQGNTERERVQRFQNQANELRELRTQAAELDLAERLSDKARKQWAYGPAYTWLLVASGASWDPL